MEILDRCHASSSCPNRCVALCVPGCSKGPTLERGKFGYSGQASPHLLHGQISSNLSHDGYSLPHFPAKDCDRHCHGISGNSGRKGLFLVNLKGEISQAWCLAPSAQFLSITSSSIPVQDFAHPFLSCSTGKSESHNLQGRVNEIY